ncbi:hypothetical protein AX774_g4523 [Zancudomyces culisetae]|uniref:Uncharacterized protein n=1 Tax=Zancudomyces culisetae TaxID=1213189 RepID=A0A1R1PM13_ZANCU|nr:hypothetical protein AX774_g4523 [Zancudomyces culisetae]|eukprot:OMH82010.1 hypothetical protein AX774_g4523 [Zancudomyces culisetae]
MDDGRIVVGVKRFQKTYPLNKELENGNQIDTASSAFEKALDTLPRYLLQVHTTFSFAGFFLGRFFVRHLA